MGESVSLSCTCGHGRLWKMVRILAQICSREFVSISGYQCRFWRSTHQGKSASALKNAPQESGAFFVRDKDKRQGHEGLQRLGRESNDVDSARVIHVVTGDKIAV